MTEKEILEQIKKLGLCTETANNGIKLEYKPYYRHNFGFHYLKSNKFEVILLKGIYKNFIRVLSGDISSINNSIWNELAKSLNIIEVKLGFPIYSKIIIKDGLIYFTSALQCSKKISKESDKRDFKIPRPLTTLEYILPNNGLSDESIILSKGFLSSLFPETVSPLLESIYNKVPDILNPIFISCNIKTSSPSIVSVYQRPYINMTGLEKVLETIGLGNSFFRCNHLPYVYIKSKNKKNKFIKKYFPINKEEVFEIIKEVEKNIPTITLSSIVEDKYLEYLIKISIVAEYIYIKFNINFIELDKYIPDLSLKLKAIYKIRQNSIFYNNKEYELPLFFDFLSETEATKFNIKKSKENIDDILASLPLYKKLFKKNKIKKVIMNIHQLLDLRDQLYFISVEFLKKSKYIFEEAGKIGVTKSYIKNKEDIFYFEHDEVKRIIAGTYFGDGNQSVIFRKWQKERYSAQIIPNEIYSTDLKKCPKISEQMLLDNLNKEEYSIISMFHKEVKGKVVSNIKQANYEDTILALSKVPLPLLKNYKGCKGIIVDNLSFLGYLIEFAAINNIPVYSGIRFAPLILSNMKVLTKHNKVIKV